jgi:hypothetical protein
MTSQRRPIEKIILQPLARALSSSSLRATPDRDSIEDYPEIRSSACWNLAIEARRISMVGPAKGNSQNSSINYLTIGGSEVYDAWTPSSNVVQNLNLDINTVRLLTIMESIQWMIPGDSPLVALADKPSKGLRQRATSSQQHHRLETIR